MKFASIEALKAQLKSEVKVEHDAPPKVAVMPPKPVAAVGSKTTKMVVAEMQKVAKRGRKPLNGERMSDAEYKRRWRARKKAGLV